MKNNRISKKHEPRLVDINSPEFEGRVAEIALRAVKNSFARNKGLREVIRKYG